MAEYRRVGVDFIGIGVQKAATSWLHDMLSAHPGIAASTPKELDFFTASYDRGYDWYEGFFRDSDPTRMRGECSPSYFCAADAPARARLYNPQFRVICILRDPVARAFSNHLHEIRKRHIPESRSFEDAMARNPMYLEQGRYRRHLGRWIDTFGRAAVLVLLAEDIARDPEPAYRAVCRHLGVSHRAAPDNLGERSHESVANRNRALQRVLRAGGDAARALGLGTAVRSVKGAPVVRGLLALNRRDLRTEMPAMQPATLAALRASFRDDIAFVAGLLERPDLPWPSLGAAAPVAEARRAG
jgi:hypothetical protein